MMKTWSRGFPALFAFLATVFIALNWLRLIHYSTTSSTSLIESPLHMMTCSRMQNTKEDKMVTSLRTLLHAHNIFSSAVFLTFSTQDTLNSLAIQINSLHEFAPLTLERFIVVCVGQETCLRCEEIHPRHCLSDFHMNDFLQGITGADSLSTPDVKNQVSKSYVDIIWRKPELIALAFQAGASEVTVVDTDGVWFADPPPFTFHNNNNNNDDDQVVLQSSSEFEEFKDYDVNVNKCQRAAHYRGFPLILNSGTVRMKNNALARVLLQEWIDSRASHSGGLCGEMQSTASKETVMLDQDGLNFVACMEKFAGKVRGLSSNAVLLNSNHVTLREKKWFSICNVWFFHATNCGGTQLKSTCLEKNVQRRRDAHCDG